MNSKAIPSIDQVRPFFQVVVFNLDNELLTDEQIIDHLKVATKEIGDKRSNLNEKYTVRTVHRSDDTLSCLLNTDLHPHGFAKVFQSC
jgi:hypothetical protein